MTKEAGKKQGEMISPPGKPSYRATMVDAVILPPPWGHTPGKKAYNNKLIYYAMGISRKN